MEDARRPERAPVNGELVDEAYRFEVGPGDGRPRLDLYLHRVFKGRSRAYWQRMIERRAVGLVGPDGLERPVRPSAHVGTGDRITVRIDLLGRGKPRAHELSYQVVHEDDAILAVNKRAGAFCHPVGRLHNRSVINDLRNDRGDEGHELRPCHRLDRFVSGLLVLAKNARAAGLVQPQFEARTVAKEYLALVHGRIADDRGRICMAMGKATDSVIRIKMGVDPTGKPAATRYEVVRRLADHTLLSLEPETGRRHQLRLHLAEIGHPIVNDPLYGPVIDVDYYERQQCETTTTPTTPGGGSRCTATA
jgi:RluA family pseudouridine synthase